MKRLGLLACCLALFLFRASWANASELSRFKHLVVFGDSLSDNGNSLFLFHLPQSPYYAGRWSNGPNWVDYFPSVAHHFSTIAAYFPNPDSGTNFAVGGSISADLLQSESTGFPAQIPTYLATTGGRAFPDDLYVIWIGANDFGEAVSPTSTAANILQGIIRLQKAGAKEFVVVNVPDISLTPEVVALGGAVALAAKEFVFTVNALLEVELLSYGWSHGIRIQLVDINSTFTQLVLNPGQFGFSNSTGEAFNPNLSISATNPVSDPNDYVFWDGFHPTTRAHLIAAQVIYHAITKRSPFPETVPVPLTHFY
jgi:phospholipase/lecithinase/hemolysin